MSHDLTDGERELLNSGSTRAAKLDALHREGREAALKLQKLVGRRCSKGGKEYEITGISYGWNGFVTARGYKIVKGGKRGSVSRWDIGPITAEAFEK